MQALLRFFSLVLTLCIVLTYLTLLVVLPVQHIHRLTPRPPFKEVVAYSLRKQIEIESEEVSCKNLKGVKSSFKFESVEGTAEALQDFGVENKGNFSAGGDEGKWVDGETFEEMRWTHLPETSVYVLGVYYDDRLEPFKYLRVLGMIKGFWNETLYCQISTEEGVRITKATRTDIWVKEWDRGDEDTFHPVLLSCYISSLTNPLNLHLSADPCVVGTSLTVLFQKRLSVSEFTVCVKPLNFIKDISDHLVQWVEMNKLLGAESFEVFVKKVPRRVLQVLDFYRRKHKGKFVVQRYTNVEDFAEKRGQEGKEGSSAVRQERRIWQKRRNEVLAYNDCLYRNLRSSHFVIPVDVDEVIVPRRFHTWGKALGHFFASAPHLEEEYASFSVQNAYFLEAFSSQQQARFFFEKTVRSGFSEPGESGKSFVATPSTLTVFNHYALESLKPGIQRTFFVPPEVLQMNHYRKTCPDVLPRCVKHRSSPVRIVDELIMKYKSQFVSSYEKVIKELRHFVVNGPLLT